LSEVFIHFKPRIRSILLTVPWRGESRFVSLIMAENQQKTTEDTLSTEDIAVEDAPESTAKTKEEATSEDQIDPIPIEPETESPSPDSATEATVQEEPQPVVASEDPESQPDDSEPESDQDEDEKSVIAPVQGMIGYTGQILGDVIKLEDLDTGIEPELHTLGSDELRERPPLSMLQSMRLLRVKLSASPKRMSSLTLDLKAMASFPEMNSTKKSQRAMKSRFFSKELRITMDS